MLRKKLKDCFWLSHAIIFSGSWNHKYILMINGLNQLFWENIKSRGRQVWQMKKMTGWNMPSNWLNWLMMSLAWRFKTISFHEPACTQWRYWPMPAQNEPYHQARRSSLPSLADSREQTIDGERRALTRPSESAVTMSVVSPGRWILIFLVFSESVIFNAFADEQNSGENDKTVVIEILDVSQPYNCSAFFDDLEVRNFIQLRGKNNPPPLSLSLTFRFIKMCSAQLTYYQCILLQIKIALLLFY